MAFGSFRVHAGSFTQGNHHRLLGDGLKMSVPGRWFRETIPLACITSVEIASEENVARIGGALGWGAVGAAALGPVGLLAGLVLGGQGKDVTFVCRLSDGRAFLATAPSAVYTRLAAATFREGGQPVALPPARSSKLNVVLFVTLAAVVVMMSILCLSGRS